jgi:hypothetical protein
MQAPTSKVQLPALKDRYAFKQDYCGLEGVAISAHVPPDESFECAALFLAHAVLTVFVGSAQQAL